LTQLVSEKKNMVRKDIEDREKKLCHSNTFHFMKGEAMYSTDPYDSFGDESDCLDLSDVY